MCPRTGQDQDGPEAGWSGSGGGSRGHLPALILFCALGPTSPAFAAALSFQGFTLEASNLAGLAVVVAASALGLAGALWALAEQRRIAGLTRALKAARAQARAVLSTRDAWLAAGRESLIVWGEEDAEPVSFAGAAQLIEQCLTGPDAAELSMALDGLSANGLPFALNCRNAEGTNIAVRGRPAGGFAAVYLEPERVVEKQLLDFRAALDVLPVPVWIRKPDLALGYVNRAFVAASGAPNAEAALASGVVLDRSEHDLASAARADNDVVEAKRFAVLAGHRHALQFTLSPLEGGGVAGCAIDVTALAEAEARLQQHIDAHADTLDRLVTAVAVFGPDRRLSFYNQAYVRLWGLSETWLDAHPTEGEILDRLRELRRLPEQPDFRAWKQQRLKIFEERDHQTEELWHLPGGKTLRICVQSHPFGGLVLLYEDVSDRLRLESSYNTLIKVQKATLDTLQEGVAVFGPDGRLKLFNAAFARIWRLEAADLAGEPHLKRIADACAARFGTDRVWEGVLSSVTSAAPERHREWGEIERSDGVIVSLSLAPLPDGATLASFADVTDRFRIESALRERNEALEASDKLKSEFVKRVSYELRTPLNSIVGFAQLLKDGTPGALNARQGEYVEAIGKASETLRVLINDILDLSQIESGAMDLDFQKVDLYWLLSTMAGQMREWTARLGLGLTLDCREDTGVFVGDARRLKQVVFNLLSNAFKYTPPGGTVTIGGDINGDDVRIFVADTGSGIAPDMMPTAFERFSAKGGGAGGRGGSAAGVGLGLALVNRFVELHDGWVELESQQGQGTRATCHLPRNPQKRRAEPDLGSAQRA
ncbi:MAG: PAS domain-containing sensor histidine kinase [Alphaproteobacteria bacterium]|nr:PAS domain-containing sensor histidine kinase [Alphaproteobacteria bacterium]